MSSLFNSHNQAHQKWALQENLPKGHRSGPETACIHAKQHRTTTAKCDLIHENDLLRTRQLQLQIDCSALDPLFRLELLLAPVPARPTAEDERAFLSQRLVVEFTAWGEDPNFGRVVYDYNGPLQDGPVGPVSFSSRLHDVRLRRNATHLPRHLQPEAARDIERCFVLSWKSLKSYRHNWSLPIADANTLALALEFKRIIESAARNGSELAWLPNIAMSRAQALRIVIANKRMITVRPNGHKMNAGPWNDFWEESRGSIVNGDAFQRRIPDRRLDDAFNTVAGAYARGSVV